MIDDKYNRSISLLCTTCGGEQFEFDGEESTTFKCGACGLEIEKEALIEPDSSHPTRFWKSSPPVLSRALN